MRCETTPPRVTCHRVTSPRPASGFRLQFPARTALARFLSLARPKRIHYSFARYFRFQEVACFILAKSARNRNQNQYRPRVYDYDALIIRERFLLSDERAASRPRCFLIQATYECPCDELRAQSAVRIFDHWKLSEEACHYLVNFLPAI